MKFMALVANTIQARVPTTPTQPSGTVPNTGRLSELTTSPLATATSAAPTWAPSFTVNGQSTRSSSQATTAMAVAARITPRK